jgi:ferredoxin-NADP reductase
LLDGGETRNYSLANAPHDNTSVELHVRRVPGGRFSDRVMAGLAFGDTVRLELPYGRVVLDDSDAPVVMLATGTGFAPLKSTEGTVSLRRSRAGQSGPDHLRAFWMIRSIASTGTP